MSILAHGKRKFEISIDDELVNNIAKASRKDTPSEYGDAMFEETEYYYEKGLRKVYPYHFTFSTFCKGRWVGKRLLDVFSAEFRAYTKEQYKQSVLNGNLKVNGLSIPVDYVLKDNDCITNKVHRHEVAVAGCPIKIIHSSDDLLVVDKPCSVPVHPCGRYRHNSLLFILAKEHDLRHLHTIHRLDRLTSGLLFFTKSLKRSQDIDDQIRSRKVQKVYLCRVDGLFPDEALTCSEPIEVLSPKIGICATSLNGKECTTTFEKLSYNGKSSLVQCFPTGGRMHQIRVHLQYLGYPIVNDPIYNHETAFGPLKGKNGETGKSREQLISDLLEIHNLEKWLKVDNEPSMSDAEKEAAAFVNETALKVLNTKNGTEIEEKYKKNEEKIVKDSACDLCQQQYKDPEPKDLVMFLHAFKYTIDNDVQYMTDLPVWAESDWTYM